MLALGGNTLGIDAIRQRETPMECTTHSLESTRAKPRVTSGISAVTVVGKHTKRHRHIE